MPAILYGSSQTTETRRPYFDVGEHLPRISAGYFEIARISLASSTGDVISIRAKINKNSIRIKVVDEYDTNFIEYKSVYNNIPTQGEIFDVIRDMNNERQSQYYWIQIVEMHELKSLNEITDFIFIDSLIYPNLNELLVEFFKNYGYEWK